MIAEILPGFYEVKGKRISQPSKRRHPWFKERPMGSFLSQPLKTVCEDLEEIRRFLTTCRYVSDQEQFGVRDHWMAPEDFEKARRGDCDDFALWTWRQLLALGYNARFVVGRSGRYGAGHAWVTFEEEGRTFLVEPLLARIGRTFPRLEILRYKPAISFEACGAHVKCFEHDKRTAEPPFRILMRLVPEWIWFWSCIFCRLVYRLMLWPFFRACSAFSTPGCFRKKG